MVSELRRKKLWNLFTTFFDHNKDGYIDKDDIETLIQKACQHKHWIEVSADNKECHEVFHKIWNEMLKMVGLEKVGKMSFDDFLKLWDIWRKDTNEIHEWYDLYEEYVYKYYGDNACDGAITANILVPIFHFFGINKDDAAAAFAKASSGKAAICRDDFKIIWKDYLDSDDPNAPGNHFLGPIEL